MSDMWLVCGTCAGDRYPIPEINGVPTISAETLTVLQTSGGKHLTAMCQTCCDDLAAAVVTINTTPGPDEAPPL